MTSSPSERPYSSSPKRSSARPWSSTSATNCWSNGPLSSRSGTEVHCSTPVGVVTSSASAGRASRTSQSSARRSTSMRPVDRIDPRGGRPALASSAGRCVSSRRPSTVSVVGRVGLRSWSDRGRRGRCCRGRPRRCARAARRPGAPTGRAGRPARRPARQRRAATAAPAGRTARRRAPRRRRACREYSGSVDAVVDGSRSARAGGAVGSASARGAGAGADHLLEHADSRRRASAGRTAVAPAGTEYRYASVVPARPGSTPRRPSVWIRISLFATWRSAV